MNVSMYVCMNGYWLPINDNGCKVSWDQIQHVCTDIRFWAIGADNDA